MTTTENLTYNYTAGANNGKISSMYNAVSGEKVTYTYDSLNRMIGASATDDNHQNHPCGPRPTTSTPLAISRPSDPPSVRARLCRSSSTSRTIKSPASTARVTMPMATPRTAT